MIFLSYGILRKNVILILNFLLKFCILNAYIIKKQKNSFVLAAVSTGKFHLECILIVLFFKLASVMSFCHGKVISKPPKFQQHLVYIPDIAIFNTIKDQLITELSACCISTHWFDLLVFKFRYPLSFRSEILCN